MRGYIDEHYQPAWEWTLADVKGREYCRGITTARSEAACRKQVAAARKAMSGTRFAKVVVK